MNYSLGGAFNSRINLNLREDKGYSYGARSFFEISQFYQSGITEEELQFTKNAIGQRDARSYETPRQKLGFLSTMMTYDLDPSFSDQQNDILQGMSKSEIDALAAKHLNIEDMIMVIVGDKEVVFDEVKALGFPIVELDEDGNPI